MGFTQCFHSAAVEYVLVVHGSWISRMLFLLKQNWIGNAGSSPLGSVEFEILLRPRPKDLSDKLIWTSDLVSVTSQTAWLVAI